VQAQSAQKLVPYTQAQLTCPCARTHAVTAMKLAHGQRSFALGLKYLEN